MPQFRIVQTTVSDKVAELLPLLQMHRDELATNKALMVLNPNWEMYRALEQNDALLALLAYCDDEIVGYSACILTKHPHYMGLTYAHNDVLFLAPAFRGGRLGIQLIHATEQAAKERGAQMVMWHAKEGTALLGMLPRMGYKVQDVIFSKEV